MWPAFGGQECGRVVLGTPGGHRAVVVYLAFYDDFQSLLERGFAPGTRLVIDQVFKIAFVADDVLQEPHDIGCQVVVERDIVLVAAIARKRPIL